MDTNSLVKQALLEIKKLKREKEMPIAIIGMACRFPNGINTPEIFWENLINKKDCITEIPKERWDMDAYYSPNRAESGKMYVKEGGFVDHIDQFDLDLFKLPAREVKYMDPQQRLFLEVSWECLERSGVNPLSLKGTKTGVYLGICTHDYALHSLYSQQMDKIDIYSFTGSAFSIASGRLSYMLGLEGPSMSIDTACSSSLVALHEACSSICNRKSEMAIVGGVNLMITPEHTIQFCKVNALSPSSRCKAFDASADGYVRSEGCGVVLLKSLDKAIEDKNQILAVIRGVVINNDGVSNSLTAPNGMSQQRLISEVLKSANVKPNQVSYVEAHGTGTPLGDPIEANSLGNVYCKDRKTPLWVGSVKTNIGHLEAAAGMAGLIKTILAIKNKKIPPNLHFQNPNPEIPWCDYDMRIPTKVEEWPEGKKIAGISAFGFSGTNAHVILEEPPVVSTKESESIFPILTLSAQNEKALIMKIEQTYDYIMQKEAVALERVCYTSNVCRPHLPFRKAFLFKDIYELKRAMSEFLDQPHHKKESLHKVTFFIPDEIYIEESSIRSMYDSNKVFREVFNTCLCELRMENLNDFLNKTHKHSKDFIVVFAVISALTLIGVNPEEITGEGKGWLAAFCACGMLSLQQGLTLLNSYLEEGSIAGFLCQLESESFKQPLYLLMHKDGSKLDMSKITDRSFWNARQNDEILSENKVWLLSIGKGSAKRSEQPGVLFWNPEDNLSFFKVVAFFYEQGTEVRWELFFDKNQFVPEALPPTPFIRSRYWVERPELKVSTDSLTSSHGFYFHKLPVYNKNSWCFVFRISRAKNKFLLDHGFLGSIVLPATAYVEMMTYASMDILGHYNFIIKNISYEQALKISSDESTELHVYIERHENGRMQITLVSHNGISGSDARWVKHASATMEEGKHESYGNIDPDDILRESSHTLDVSSYYEHLNHIGYLFGELHQGIKEISTDGIQALAKVILPSALEMESDKYFYHPALLDACSQTFMSFIPKDLPDDSIYITIGTEKFVPYQRAEGELFVVAQVTDKGANNLKGNIFIYNSKREIVAAVIGYMTKKVSKSALQQTTYYGCDYCYKTVWMLKDEQTTVNGTDGRYILWADRSPFSQDVCNQLQKQGSQCIMVYPSEAFKMVREYEFELDATNTEHIVLFKKQLERLSTDGRPLGSIYLMSLGYSFSPLTQNIKKSVEVVCKPLWNIAKELYRNKDFSIQNLTVITQNASNILFGDYWTNPVSTAVWGFIKVMNLEYPWIKCKAIDISEKGIQQCELISRELLCQSEDSLIAFRNGQRYVQRLSRLVTEPAENQSIFNEAYALRLKAKGSIEYLDYEKVPRTEPADDEVEIEVMVSGFNFHDIIHVLNLMKEESSHFGLDCVGRIVRAGKKVLDLKVDDIVIAFAPGCFGKYVTVTSSYVIKKPNNLNAFEAATIPSAYMTAYHIVSNILSLEKGRSILVHAATGGLGVALINLAQNIGLTVYATASKNKWFLLKQMGVEHIFDSRSAEYAEQILAMTENKGVDAVVNSFTGEHIAKGFSVLKSGGYFIEVGEREKLTGEQVLKYHKDVIYTTVSLFDVIKDEPQKAKEMLVQLVNLLGKGDIKPIPYQVCDRANIKDAFRFIQKGKHTGKILVDFSGEKEHKGKRTVIITGGANGIGWEIAKYWAKNFDDSLVLLGRSPETLEIHEKLKSVRQKGKDIIYYSVDIGDSKALCKVLSEVNAKLPPLKGIIHSAGVISDKLIKDESWENIEKVLTPKIFGVWNLHNLTLVNELDFFILFSSVTAVLGSIGVSGYATGNSFMEGFAQYRRQLGLPCLCLNWGPWQEIGMLTRLNKIATEIWTQNGFESLPSDEGVKIFDGVKGSNDNISIMPVDWNKWFKQYSTGKIPDLISNFTVKDNSEKNSDRIEAKKQEVTTKNSASDTREKVLEDIQKIFKRVLQRNVSEDEFEKLSFQEIGLDSLMSVEFRNLLNERFKADFAISLLYSYPDLKSLHKHISDEVLGISSVSIETKPVENKLRDRKPNDLDAMQQINESKDLSIIDLRKLLDEKLDFYSTK